MRAADPGTRLARTASSVQELLAAAVHHDGLGSKIQQFLGYPEAE